jgi:Domain of unknown function (DUF4136)
MIRAELQQSTRTGAPREDRAGRPLRSRLTILACAVAVAIAVQSGSAAVKVHADFDKAFDFSQARTWAWNPKDAGDVMVARTPDDDPEVIQQRADPVIKEAVSREMPRRGLKPAAGTPDLTLVYYLLLTVGASAQTMGQFLPPVSAWGLPPFAPSTSSLEVIEQGSLVLDLSANGQVVWRGIGQAKIKMGLPQDKRAALIHEAVREILERYPPKK